ncbi:MAG: carbohydrate ABC transporter permease [Actinomycetales bacterium]
MTGLLPPARDATATPAGTSVRRRLPRRIRRHRARSLVVGLLTTVVLGLAMLPLAYLTTLAFMQQSDILDGGVLPSTLTLDNWRDYWERLPLTGFFVNSMIAAGLGTLLSLAVATPAAYAIVRFRTGGSVLPAFVLSAFIAPPVVAIVPMFFLLRWIGLLNDPVGLAVVYGLVNVSVATWLLQSFVARIPVELEEAARLDGAGTLRTLVSVVLPLMTPGLVATGIVLAILNVNEFLLALTVTQSPGSQTLPVAISLFQGDRGVQFGQMAAASLTAMLPVYIGAVLVQRWLVDGLADGAVK